MDICNIKKWFKYTSRLSHAYNTIQYQILTESSHPALFLQFWTGYHDDNEIMNNTSSWNFIMTKEKGSVIFTVMIIYIIKRDCTYVWIAESNTDYVNTAFAP